MRVVPVTLVVYLLCTGCAGKEHWLPAVPDAPRGPAMWLPLVDPLPEPPAPPNPVAVLAQEVEQVPVQPAPVVIPSADEWAQYRDAKAPKEPEKPAELPAKTISRANALATMSPSRQGFANDASVIQHYPYQPGARYEVYTSPNAPTSVLLPVGEKLAAGPMLNPEAWDVAVLEAGQGAELQQVVIVRPLTVGLDATIALFTQSGLRFFCRLRSFEKTAMVAVGWMLPRVRPKVVQEQLPESPSRSMFHPPMIDHSRLHTAYTMRYDTNHTPPWVPTSVFDDGKQTIIAFKEPLDYTNAPVLAVQHADGKPGVVQWTAYIDPKQPEKGAFYVAGGLWPVLTLKGTDGYEVHIIRQP